MRDWRERGNINDYWTRTSLTATRLSQWAINKKRVTGEIDWIIYAANGKSTRANSLGKRLKRNLRGIHSLEYRANLKGNRRAII